MSREVVVVSAVRTPVGGFGGSLKDVPTCDLGALVIRESIARAGLEGKDIQQVVMGNVINTEPRDMYLSRVATINGGCPIETIAMNVNRICGSGLQSVVSIAQAIKLGDCDIGIGAGAENMSRGPYLSTDARAGLRMGDKKIIDMMVGALTDPFEKIHMGITAENVAAKWNISREDQDKLAVLSHNNAERAWAENRFKDQIVPVTIKTRKGDVVFEKDEHFRAGMKIENIQNMKPAFLKENGTVTAGNASGINDGAAAIVLMEAEAAKARGLKPLARLVSYAIAGVEPKYMGIGPVPASRLALQKAGLKMSDMDVIEANEAFAAQALAVARELEIDPAKLNPNGSGISLGHPVGASGNIVAVKTIHELQRIGGRYGLTTLCIGAGQGIAAIFERM